MLYQIDYPEQAHTKFRHNKQVAAMIFPKILASRSPNVKGVSMNETSTIAR